MSATTLEAFRDWPPFASAKAARKPDSEIFSTGVSRGRLKALKFLRKKTRDRFWSRSKLTEAKVTRQKRFFGR